MRNQGTHCEGGARGPDTRRQGQGSEEPEPQAGSSSLLRSLLDSQPPRQRVSGSCPPALLGAHSRVC